jgi:hypothetical protein
MITTSLDWNVGCSLSVERPRLTRTSLLDFHVESAFCLCFNVICEASVFVSVILLLFTNYRPWKMAKIFQPYLRRLVMVDMELEPDIFGISGILLLDLLVGIY